MHEYSCNLVIWKLHAEEKNTYHQWYNTQTATSTGIISIYNKIKINSPLLFTSVDSTLKFLTQQ